MSEWIHYLSRPFSLLGASIWHRWYDSSEIEKLFGVRLPHALLIQQESGLVRHYLDKSEFEAFKGAIRSLILHDYARAQEILRKGEEMNARVIEYISLGPTAFSSFDEAVSFLIDLTLHATIFPYFFVPFSFEEHVGDDRDREFAEKLRGVSHYGDFLNHVVLPLAGNRLTCSSVGDAPPKKLFILEYNGDSERITWCDSTEENISALEGSIEREQKILSGRSAFPGVSRGRARIIVRPEAGQRFDKGNILVTVNSNPSFMPYINMSSAIVTDEGGITCHAAIVARELQKPCVTGTKFATQVLKDGDEVEVDADHGIVRMLSR